MKNSAWIIGFIFGMILAIIVYCIIGKRRRESGHTSNPCEYDERQNIVRGQAFKLAYLTAIGLAIAIGLLDMIFDLRQLGLFTFAIIILWVSICVFTAHAVLHDAYFTLRKRRRPMTSIFLTLGIVNVALAIDGIVDNGWIIDGALSMHCTNLITGASLLCLGCVMLFKTYLDRKAADEE